MCRCLYFCPPNAWIPLSYNYNMTLAIEKSLEKLTYGLLTDNQKDLELNSRNYPHCSPSLFFPDKVKKF
jgi:hypothetical protein